MAYNYNQPPGGYQRPGSTASFQGPPPPPAYGPPQPYVSTISPSAQSQWAPPSQTPVQHQWNQPPAQQTWGQAPPQQSQQQAAPGYNPGTYGVISGGNNQGAPPLPPHPQQSNPPYNSQYQNQQQDIPPPPPPKIGPPFDNGAQQHQSTQNWQQLPGYNVQQGHPQPSQAPGYGQQSGYNQQGGHSIQQGQQAPYQGQAVPQQQYSSAVPPPPSQTPGGSYFLPPGRPSSIYGQDQFAQSTPPSAMSAYPPSSVLSPNEQQPAYIPPSLSGQGVQAYVPNNTNPLPGVYVPPPPDIPAWQQAQHAPLQPGTKKFKYTKPVVDPSYEANTPQAYSGQQQPFQQQNQYQQPSQPYGQSFQNQFQPPGQQQSGQLQQHFGQPSQPQQYHPTPLQQQSQQHADHDAQDQWTSPPPSQGPSQNDPPPPPYSGPSQPPQPQNAAHVSILGQTYFQGGPNQPLQAPKPLHAQVQAAQNSLYNNDASGQSPGSVPVSPIHNRHGSSFSPGLNNSTLGRTSSVSSTALGRQQVSTSTPVQISPTPPQSTVAASALGFGGPSDWEHFGAGVEEIDDEELFAARRDGIAGVPQQLDSVELPSKASPPSMASDVSQPEEWPSPAAPAPLNVSRPDSGLRPVPPTRRDTFQPTPPPNVSQASTQASQGFVMDEPIVAVQNNQPPRPLESTPAGRAFVMDDGGWETAQASTSKDLPSHPIGGFVVDNGGRATPTQASQNRASQEALEKFKAQAEKENADLAAQIGKLKADAEKDKEQSTEQIESLQTELDLLQADKAKFIGEAEAKDKVLKEEAATIERLKEDIEGKDNVIAERDSAINALKQEVEKLKRELDTPKEVPPPQPRDLVSDIDPWYAGSLERYIAMLRTEANAPVVEEKMKAFKGFLAAESGFRGLPYYSEPPSAPAPSAESAAQMQPPATISRTSSPSKTPNTTVTIPQPPTDEPEEYSPGGRPILPRRPTLTSDTSVSTLQSFSVAPGPTERAAVASPTKASMDPVTDRRDSQYKPFRGSISQSGSEVSTQSTVVLTPTSSAGDEFSKAMPSSPEQPTPPAQPSQQQYKAYIPFKPSEASTSPSREPVTTPVSHRQSMSFSVAPLQPSGKHDEVFFGGALPQPSSKPTSRPTTSTSSKSNAAIPAPLNPNPAPTPKPNKSPLATLSDLLPSTITTTPPPHPRLESMRQRISALPAEFSYITTLTKTWETSAAKTRAKLSAERQKRQEESEARTDELFNDNEISYAEIGNIEEECKVKERERKAQEDREEYRSYVDSVFDGVYDRLQGEIRQLMDAFVEAENLLATSSAGKEALDDTSNPTTLQTLHLLREIHASVELRHENVVEAVKERDKRYKKTEIQPLYAAGNIAKMKSVERHFEGAEKAALVRAKSEKGERIAGLVRIVEEATVNAVGRDQAYSDEIITSLRALIESSELDAGAQEVVKEAEGTLEAVKKNSVALLGVFHEVELELNAAVFEAEIAQARGEGKGEERVRELEGERGVNEGQLRGEFGRKVEVLEEGMREVGGIVKSGDAGGKRGGGEVVEEKGEKMDREAVKKTRLKAALEEAKRRNGDL